MISKKEFISFFQILIVILCTIIFYILTISQRFPNDLNVLKAQCAYFKTGSICLIFALGTWFYCSSVRRTRIQLRVFKAVVLWALLVIVFLYGQIGETYEMDEIKKFDANIWNEAQTICLDFIDVMCYVVVILMFVMNSIIVGMLIISLTKLWTKGQRKE